MDILYTLAPIALAETPQPPLEEMCCDGVNVSVRKLADGRYQIVQILSTRPADFLRNELAPGMIIDQNR